MTDPTSGSTSLNTSHGATSTGASSKGKKTKGGSSANKGKKASRTSSHPKYSVMIKQAITHLNDRNGTSKVAILKYILANYKVNPAMANQHLKLALRAGTKNKTLKQTKGVGASGSFKLASASKKKASSTGKKKNASKKSTSTKSRSRSMTSSGTKKASGTKTKKARSSSKAKSADGAKKRKRSASPAKKAAAKKVDTGDANTAALAPPTVATPSKKKAAKSPEKAKKGSSIRRTRK